MVRFIRTERGRSNTGFLVKQCSHFLQAHALLNLHIIHSSQSAPSGHLPDGDEQGQRTRRPNSASETPIHPNLGPGGFNIYSPTTHDPSSDRAITMIAGYYSADFTAMQLLKVMSRLTQRDVTFLSYFHLCRELGVRAVDGMIKGRVLDLRWTEAVVGDNHNEVDAREGEPEAGMHVGTLAGSSGTAVGVVTEEDGDTGPVFPDVTAPRDPVEDDLGSEEEIVGPKLVPTTPIMRFAMRDVVAEYEDQQSVSEYASLSDVDEY
jgi:hypothetical protein